VAAVSCASRRRRGVAESDALRSRWGSRRGPFLGMPEGDTALAQLVVYLALAPKSTRSNGLCAALAGCDREAAVPVRSGSERSGRSSEGSGLRGNTVSPRYDDAIVRQRLSAEEWGTAVLGGHSARV